MCCGSRRTTGNPVGTRRGGAAVRAGTSSARPWPRSISAIRSTSTEAAYGGGPSIERLGRALAAYQRSLLSANSPFDRWFFGREEAALDERAKDGFALFTGRAGCANCHLIEVKSALFTDHRYHFTGIGFRGLAARAAPAGPVKVTTAWSATSANPEETESARP